MATAATSSSAGARSIVLFLTPRTASTAPPSTATSTSALRSHGGAPSAPLHAVRIGKHASPTTGAIASPSGTRSTRTATHPTSTVSSAKTTLNTRLVENT